jgi:hypothetical protein
MRTIQFQFFEKCIIFNLGNSLKHRPLQVQIQIQYKWLCIWLIQPKHIAKIAKPNEFFYNKNLLCVNDYLSRHKSLSRTEILYN